MITPTKPDEDGVRWCNWTTCRYHIEHDTECGGHYKYVRSCHVWLRAVLKANQLWLDGEISHNDLWLRLDHLQTDDDIEPIYRELFP